MTSSEPEESSQVGSARARFPALSELRKTAAEVQSAFGRQSASQLDDYAIELARSRIGDWTMHISRVQLVNFRNFRRADAVFNKGVNTIIGENGSGKTNLFRAIRLLLDDDLMRWAFRLDEGDFHRGLGNWRGHWIIISIEFSEVSQDEAIQALFLHGTGVVEDGAVARATYNLIFRPNTAIRTRLGELAEGDAIGLAQLLQHLTTNDYETVFTGKSTANFTDPATYAALVGDFENVKFPTELIRPEIGGPDSAHPLGVEGTLLHIHPGFARRSRRIPRPTHQPAADTAAQQEREIEPSKLEPITKIVKELNDEIEKLPDVGEIRADIRQTIRDTAGETYSPANLAVRSGVPAEAERLFQSLRLYVGETEHDYEGAIHEPLSGRSQPHLPYAETAGVQVPEGQAGLRQLPADRGTGGAHPYAHPEDAVRPPDLR